MYSLCAANQTLFGGSPKLIPITYINPVINLVAFSFQFGSCDKANHTTLWYLSNFFTPSIAHPWRPRLSEPLSHPGQPKHTITLTHVLTHTKNISPSRKLPHRSKSCVPTVPNSKYWGWVQSNNGPKEFGQTMILLNTCVGRGTLQHTQHRSLPKNTLQNAFNISGFRPFKRQIRIWHASVTVNDY